MGSATYGPTNTSGPYGVNYIYISGSAPPSDSSGESVLVSSGSSYVGARTSGYYRKLRSGELLPQNPYYRFDYRKSRSNGSYRGRYSSPTKSYLYTNTVPRGWVDGCSDHVNPVDINDTDSAIGHVGRLAAQVNEEALLQRAFAQCQPDLDLLTTLVEAHKTIDMLLHARKRFLSLISDMRKGGFTSVKAAASSWLEFRYGWRILGYDIQNANDFYNTPIRGNILTGRAGDSVRERTNFVSSVSTNYYANYDWCSQVDRDLSIRANAAVKYDLESINALTSPFTTAWETIPYSFVADWFVSVGDAISAWDVLRRSIEHNASISYKMNESGSAQVKNVTLGVGTYANDPYCTGNASHTSEFKYREPRSFDAGLPEWRVRLTSGRILDAAALLIGISP